MEHHSDNTNRIILPVSLSFFGEGAPVGNDPGRSAQRSLSQTLVYLCRAEEKTAAKLAEEIHSFMRRNLPKNVKPELLLWAMMPDIVGGFTGQVCAGLAGFFLDARPRERPATAVAVANLPEQSCFYSCDSIVAHDICGYSNILIRNLYGSRLQAHFRCGHNMTADPQLLLTVRCAGGRPLSALSYEEREIAGRALRQGYLWEHDGILEPAILVLADGISVYIEFQSLLGALEEDTRQMADDLAGELAGFMREHIPSHLLADYSCYGSGIASHCFFHDVVEECIRRGILSAPIVPLGPEGVLLVLCI